MKHFRNYLTDTPHVVATLLIVGIMETTGVIQISHKKNVKCNLLWKKS